ncbi:MAG: YbbR-like domain-containing protein, partial [Candidatus Dormibacteria bacterium]
MRLPGFLTRNLRLKALAVALAMLSWVGVVFAGNPPETRTVSVHVPQEATRIPAKYVLVRPIPDIPVRMAGTREHLRSFDTSSLSVVVDFGAIRHAGVQSVPVSVTNADRDVDLDSAPAAVELEVDELGSIVLPVTIVITNPPPSGYVTSGQAVEPDRVTVAGPRQKLGGTQARARVDLSNQKANLQQDFPLLLFDAAGNRISDLGVTPPTVRVTVTVAASATSRATAVLPRTTGTVAAGHQLSGIAADPPTVLLAGPQDLINSLDSVSTTPIALNGLGEDTTVSVRLAPPAGVRATPDTVNVRLTVTALPGPPAAPAP